MKTTNVESLTNSIMMVIAKEFAKNGMTKPFGEQYDVLRGLIRTGVVMPVVSEHLSRTHSSDQLAE